MHLFGAAPKIVHALLSLLMIASTAGFCQERKLEPVDEAAADPSWISFRNRLLNAVEKRDLKFVLSILDRNVRSSLNRQRGIPEFRKQWDVTAADSPLWRELKAALFLGSAYLKRDKGPRELCAPYLLAKWPQDLIPHDYGVIITRDVLVKAAPSSDAKTLQTLSYDIVAVTDWEVANQVPTEKQLWVKVQVKSGEGYVPEEQVRSAIEHSACFVKTESGWRMTGFAPAGG
ncbi:MAG TPA: hypothetical protein VKF40_07500 [Burkholderiales bacterium]|nr:hypothetical protein [Burkholderiales bacterium]